jgi:hypothetical protein
VHGGRVQEHKSNADGAIVGAGCPWPTTTRLLRYPDLNLDLDIGCRKGAK